MTQLVPNLGASGWGKLLRSYFFEPYQSSMRALTAVPALGVGRLCVFGALFRLCLCPATPD